MPFSSPGIHQGLVFATAMSYMGQRVNINQPEYALLECSTVFSLDEHTRLAAML